MKELVICSGKGGTGKTSVTAAFAALAPGAVLADCDVDAADLHLVLEPRIRRRAEFRSGHEAIIRPDDCLDCGLCEETCRFGAITRVAVANGGQTRAVDPVGCEGCGVCVHFCPARAIDFPETVCGEWFLSETRHGPMVHARLGIGAENSGKLVTLVRTQARKLAEEEGRDLLLVDGPPGIGCPVIASLSGADAVLVVTEPTVSGLHDLQRVARLAGHFEIPASVCVNKSDISPDMTERIESWCEGEGLPVAGRLPYHPAFTNAQLAGRSIVEHGDSPAAAAVKTVWGTIMNSLR